MIMQGDVSRSTTACNVAYSFVHEIKQNSYEKPFDEKRCAANRCLSRLTFSFSTSRFIAALSLLVNIPFFNWLRLIRVDYFCKMCGRRKTLPITTVAVSKSSRNCRYPQMVSVADIACNVRNTRIALIFEMFMRRFIQRRELINDAKVQKLYFNWVLFLLRNLIIKPVF